MKLPKFIRNSTFMRNRERNHLEMIAAQRAKIKALKEAETAELQLIKAQDVADQVRNINRKNHFSPTIEALYMKGKHS